MCFKDTTKASFGESVVLHFLTFHQMRPQKGERAVLFKARSLIFRLCPFCVFRMQVVGLVTIVRKLNGISDANINEAINLGSTVHA